MATYARIMLGTLLLGCAQEEPPPPVKFLLGDGSIRLDEDGSASVLLSAEVLNTSETLTYEIVDTPKLGKLVGSGAIYEYAPQDNANGEDSFTWRAVAGDDASEPATVTVTIAPVNDAPRGQTSQVTTTEDEPYTDVLPVSDVEGDELTFLLVTAPQFGLVTIGDDGGYTYTPEANFVGIDSFLWSAQDPAGASTGPVRVDVNVVEMNDPPVIGDTSFSVAEDQILNDQITAVDPDGDALMWSVVTLPANGDLTLDPTFGTFSYRPNPDFFGPETFQVVANDGTVDSDVTTINVAVTAVNDRPVVTALTLSTPEDTPLSDTIVANDIEGSTLTYRVQDAPRDGTVILDGTTGAFTYTPNPNANGTDDFTVIASDPTSDSLPGRITIQVAPVNDPPSLQNVGLLTTDEDVPVGGAVVGTDPEGDTLTYILDAAPANGSVTVAPVSGSLVYIPNPNFNGNDQFMVSATDGLDNAPAVLVEVVVLSINDRPTPQTASISTLTNTESEVQLVATDPEGDSLIYLIDTVPSNGSAIVDAASGRLIYRPDTNYSGPDALVWAVTDGELTATSVLPISIAVDTDQDGFADSVDNCPTVANESQGDIGGNGVGDACDCYADSFTDTLDPEFWATSFETTNTTANVTSPDHALRLNGDGAFVETVAIPGCASFFYSMQVAAGPPAPEVGDMLVLSARKDGGPWIEITTVMGTGNEESYDRIEGQTSAVTDLDNGMIEFRIEVIGDETDDLFFIDDLDLSCDNDSDFLGDCIESTLDGYDMTVADADMDGLLDGDEFAKGTNPNSADTDFDGVNDDVDNCPIIVNPAPQIDTDGDGLGDVCDLLLEEDFDTGDADVTQWLTAQPVGDGAVEQTFSFSPSYSMRLSHGLAGSFESLPTDFSACQNVAWFFRIKAGSDAPGTNDDIFFEAWNGLTWSTLYSRTGTFSQTSFEPVVGTTSDPLLVQNMAQVRFFTEDNNFTVGDDDWFIDDIALGCDADADGLANVVEVEIYGTDPFNTDTDSDGVPDGTEVNQGTNPAKAPIAGIDAEPNNTFAEADVNNAYNLGTGGDFTAVGDMFSLSDTDYYRIETTAQASWRMETTDGPMSDCPSLSLDSRIYLYNSSGSQIGFSEDDGVGFCSLLTTTQPAGIYYVRVDRWPNATFDYTLNISILP